MTDLFEPRSSPSSRPSMDHLMADVAQSSDGTLQIPHNLTHTTTEEFVQNVGSPAQIIVHEETKGYVTLSTGDRVGYRDRSSSTYMQVSPAYQSFPSLNTESQANEDNEEASHKSKQTRTTTETVTHWADNEPSLPLIDILCPGSGPSISEEDKKWSLMKRVRFQTEREWIYGAIEPGDLDDSEDEGYASDNGNGGDGGILDFDDGEVHGSDEEDEPLPERFKEKMPLSPLRGLKRGRRDTETVWGELLGAPEMDEGYESGGEGDEMMVEREGEA